MQGTITDEELDAAVSVVQSLVSVQCACAVDSPDSSLAECGISAADDSRTLLSWRLYDAFFATVEPEEIDPAASISDIALLAGDRQPVNRWNETPMFLFHRLRKVLAAKHGKEPADISWHTDFYGFHNANRGRWSFLTDVDCAWDDLLTELETELGPECELWDNLRPREPRWPFMEHVSTVGEMTNILWRFRCGGGDDPPLPRFCVRRPRDDALPDRVLVAARQQVARLLAVLGLSNATSAPQSASLVQLILDNGTRSFHDVGHDRRHVKRYRAVLELELRRTLQAHQTGLAKFLALPNSLSRSVKTVEDLGSCVANSWVRQKRDEHRRTAVPEHVPGAGLMVAGGAVSVTGLLMVKVFPATYDYVLIPLTVAVVLFLAGLAGFNARSPRR